MTQFPQLPNPAPGTGQLARQRATGPIRPDALSAALEAGATDHVTLSAGRRAPLPELPPVIAKLAARDQEALRALPPEVLREIVADLPANPEAAKLALSGRLLGRAASLVPGQGATFDPPQLFRVADAAIAFEVLHALTPADRSRLEGVTFRRVPHSTFDAGHQTRETDGAAVVAVERGRGVLGKVGYQMAELFERVALLAPLGLMLRAWFPHALAEYRSRVIEIGDAQATRMKEVLVHEVGHQVQFGPATDLAGMREWAKLSGWQDARGTEAFGLDDQGQVRALDPGVRPARTDNFVYESFTEDLTPAAVAKVLGEIRDPALRKEFEQTLRVKQNLSQAIEEIFGVKTLGYSMVNPLEDFAESFRAFYTEPELLLRKAPDKFLYLNSQSRRYPPGEVPGLLAAGGHDPKAVATAMAASGLSQESFERIARTNGIQADAQVLGAQAGKELQSARKSGRLVPPLRQAFLTLQQKVAAGDQGFAQQFVKEPAKALAGVWERLSPAEQAQLGDEARRADTVAQMQRGGLSYASAAATGYRAIEVEAVRRFGRRLLDDAFFRKALQQDPGAALAPMMRSLPTVLRRAVEDPAMHRSVAAFAEALDDLIAYDKVPLLGGGDLHKMFEANLAQLDEGVVAATIGTLRSDPRRMAEVFCGLGLAEVNGIKVPPGG
ncbi:MAG: hypothetical protein VKS61_17375 [Candidatus Sericytochromatia bacterium]|nr:hypothetical protein [Candidatus Sericytochromatia bacterium]